MSYPYNIEERRRQRLNRALRDERSLNRDIKALQELRKSIYKTILRQGMAKSIVEARDAAAQVRRLLDLLNLVCSQTPAVDILRGRHYGAMLYVCDLQSQLDIPAAERIHFELRGKPLTNSPFDEDEPQDASEQT